MIVKSINGFIKFYPQEPEDLVKFARLFKIDLVREYDYFTFEALAGLPRYSIAGMMFGNIIAVKTYEGRDASDVMLKNGFVYSFSLKALVPMLTLPNSVAIKESLWYGVTPAAFLQPGARVDGSTQRILSYSGWLSLDYQKLYVFDRGIV